MEYIVTYKTPEHIYSIETVGGKGLNLLKLQKLGFNVPPFIILSTLCFKDFISNIENELNNELLKINSNDLKLLSNISENIKKLFFKNISNFKLIDKIINAIDEYIGKDCYLAIRSSATTEDSKEFSYAGQLDTFLFKKTKEEILNSIINCFASIYSERIISYRLTKNISQFNLSLAVIIQKMINSYVSGVTFTVNPISCIKNEMLINSVYGLGEGLVSGKLDADQYICKKNSIGIWEIKESKIASKLEEIVFNYETKSGTKINTLNKELQNKSSLNERQVLAIANICSKIEETYGNPQDVEWTIEKDNPQKIYILQTRPITTISKVIPSDTDYKTIWDNSNIVESYSGITLPLTFSFALNAYHMVYVQFCEVLKVSKQKIIDNDFYFKNMLGLLNGRVYYNIKNWCRLISVLPGYNYNRRFMEQMMGVKSKIDFTPYDNSNLSFFKKYFVELPSLLWSGLNLAWQFLTIENKIEEFMGIYKKMYEKYQNFDFDKVTTHEIINIYNELVNSVLRNWKAPIINDFMAMIFYGLLRLLIEKWNLNEEGMCLENELVSKQGNVESTMPLKKLSEIALFIKSNPKLYKIFNENNEQTLVCMFIKNKNNEADEISIKLSNMLKDYLNEYGYRSMNELKLEVPSLMEKPDFIFTMLKNYILKDNLNVDNVLETENICKKAEEVVRKKLEGKKIFGIISKLLIFNFIVKNTRRAVAFREYQRFARTKMFGLARKIFLALGKKLVEFKVIDDINDIFYLTCDEIFAYVCGTALTTNLRELISLRKKEYEKFEKMDELPDRIETFGPVYCNDFEKIQNLNNLSNQNLEGETILKGLSCCPGIVRGKVKVILSPSDNMSLNGEILVAGKTDPGWVPLYPSASGLLIERGSILSHSAIVARELGLPTIVGITNVTKILKTGDEVEMDGAKGIVKIIKKNN